MRLVRQRPGSEAALLESTRCLDFHDVSVWGVKSALQAAFDAGLRAAGGAPKQTVHRVRKVHPGNGSAAALQA